MDKLHAWLCLVLFQTCSAVWDTANYQVFRGSSGVTSQAKLQGGVDYLDPWFCAVMVNYSTLESTGLPGSWCRNADAADGYTYLVKTYSRDKYDTPVGIIYHQVVQYNYVMSDKKTTASMAVIKIKMIKILLDHLQAHIYDCKNKVKRALCIDLSIKLIYNCFQVKFCYIQLSKIMLRCLINRDNCLKNLVTSFKYFDDIQ